MDNLKFSKGDFKKNKLLWMEIYTGREMGGFLPQVNSFMSRGFNR